MMAINWKAGLQRFGGLMTTLILSSFLFSPILWLTQTLLAEFIDIKQFLHTPPSPDSIQLIRAQLHALGANVLLTQMLPVLLLCLLINIGYAICLNWLGQRLAQRLGRLLPSKG